MRNVFMGMAIAGVVAVGLLGCGDDDGPTVVKKPFSMYTDASTPEEVLEDLQTSYRRREIDRYAELLSAEFQFHFQEEDARGLPGDFWTHDEDSIATRCLFEGQGFVDTGGQVTDIRVELTLAASDTASLERLPGQSLRMIRVTRTFLDIDLSEGVTLRIDGDEQEFHFREGRASSGEDPDRWYIVDWRDLGYPGFQKPAPELERISWGAIKASSCPR